MLSAVAKFNPGALIHLRRDLMALRKSVFHEREILTKICRRDCPFVSDKAIYHYRDIYDHLARFFELVEACRDLVTSLMEMYLSLLNNEMTDFNRIPGRTDRRGMIGTPANLIAPGKRMLSSQTPTLVLRGTLDHWCEYATIERFAAQIPSARAIEIRGAGRFDSRDDPGSRPAGRRRGVGGGDGAGRRSDPRGTPAQGDGGDRR